MVPSAAMVEMSRLSELTPLSSDSFKRNWAWLCRASERISRFSTCAGIVAMGPPARNSVAETDERLFEKISSIDGSADNDACFAGVSLTTAALSLPGSADTSKGEAAAISSGRWITTDMPAAVPETGSYMNWSNWLGSPIKRI